MINRKNGKLIMENIIFIVLNLLFIVSLLVFIWQHGTPEGLTEDIYAKKIALMIDAAEKPYTSIFLDISELGNLAKSNGYQGSTVIIEGNTVLVKVSHNSGNNFKFFNDVTVEIEDIGSPDRLKLIIR